MPDFNTKKGITIKPVKWETLADKYGKNVWLNLLIFGSHKEKDIFPKVKTNF